jgi:predicted lipoprotein with Yx(FWY)xxD motif
VGSFSVVARKDGARQWAYDEHPLYTSYFDHEAGDVLGGTTLRTGGASPAERVPVGPPPNIPPGFSVATTRSGRMLINIKRFAVYSYDKDTATKSACTDDCAVTWNPMTAPESAIAQGEWSIIERSPGIRQWAYRKKPLYTYALDTERESQVGSDELGWHNVYTQTPPALPKDFTLQETDTGTVVADRRGMTVYIYGCGDDAQDQLACDHPDSTQAFRFAMCGGGDADVCVKNWPYVIAAKDAKSGSRSWGTMWINPKTGHSAKADESGALHVWTFRERPVYTWSGDKAPGDTDGDGRGEFVAHREGFKAFWVRDDYFGAAD